MNTGLGRKSGPKRRPHNGHDYLVWLRAQPCLLCNPMRTMAQVSRTEAAHVGDRGLGQKCPDHQALPLCSGHHRLFPDAHHKLGKKFWKHHGIDREERIAHYHKQYTDETGRSPKDDGIPHTDTHADLHALQRSLRRAEPQSEVLPQARLPRGEAGVEQRSPAAKRRA